jgi:hypothetical protein
MTTAAKTVKSRFASSKVARAASGSLKKLVEKPQQLGSSTIKVSKTGVMEPPIPVTAASGYLDVKQAVRAAFSAFSEFFPSLKDANVLLEEVEESEDGKCWQITIGYDAKHKLSGVHAMFGPQDYRVYKSFKIDKTTGKILHMKIRSVK